MCERRNYSRFLVERRNYIDCFYIQLFLGLFMSSPFLEHVIEHGANGVRSPLSDLL
jgi:hypothetical protein